MFYLVGALRIPTLLMTLRVPQTPTTRLLHTTKNRFRQQELVKPADLQGRITLLLLYGTLSCLVLGGCRHLAVKDKEKKKNNSQHRALQYAQKEVLKTLSTEQKVNQEALNRLEKRTEAMMNSFNETTKQMSELEKDIKASAAECAQIKHSLEVSTELVNRLNENTE